MVEICPKIFTYANLIEEGPDALDDVVIDELQRTIPSFRKQMTNHTRFPKLQASLVWLFDSWMLWVPEKELQPATYPVFEYDYDWIGEIAVFFFALAIQANLKRYIECKLATNAHLAKRSYVQRPMLDRALRPPRWSWWTCRIDSNMIHLLVAHGADPNQELTVYQDGDTLSYAWTTVWALFLKSLYDAKLEKTFKPPELVQEEFQAIKLLIEYGAAADLRPWRIQSLQEHLGSRMLTPSDIFHEVFPARDALVLDQLLQQYRPWALRQVCSWLRRTVLLWFYRNIQFTTWLLRPLFPIFFNDLAGVIFPMVLIPIFVHCIWLLGQFVSGILSGTAPLLLPVLILSDWMPIPNSLVWFNDLLVWRDNRLLWRPKTIRQLRDSTRFL